MLRFGTRRGSNGKKSRSITKFPRGAKVLKNYEGTHLPMRKLFGWEEGYMVTAEKMKRFLLSNVGRPVDKVYSEFLKRCDKTITNPKETFFEWIKKKDELDYWGGFYITNGILNYKKKRKTIKRKFISYESLNKEILPHKEEILKACRKAKEAQGPVLLGRFYVYDRDYSYNSRLKTIYVIPKDVPSFYTKNVNIIGFGAGVDVYEESFNYKLRSRVIFLQRYELRYGYDVYEFVIKERKR